MSEPLQYNYETRLLILVNYLKESTGESVEKEDKDGDDNQASGDLDLSLPMKKKKKKKKVTSTCNF